jgi:hypothetical protein
VTGPVIVSPVVTAVTEAISSAMVGSLVDVKTLDAGDPLQQYAQRSVTVGGTWDPDAQAFVTDETISTQVVESGAARRMSEVTSIRCIAYAGAGGSTLPALRVSVGAILAAVRSAVRAITAIDGLAARAQVVEEQWAQGSDDQGSLVMALFTVQATRLL